MSELVCTNPSGCDCLAEGGVAAICQWTRYMPDDHQHRSARPEGEPLNPYTGIWADTPPPGMNEGDVIIARLREQAEEQAGFAERHSATFAGSEIGLWHHLWAETLKAAADWLEKLKKPRGQGTEGAGG